MQFNRLTRLRKITSNDENMNFNALVYAVLNLSLLQKKLIISIPFWDGANLKWLKKQCKEKQHCLI